ncbi:MAG: AAA family ATPase, partial [Bifidobacteriaceae bacterium]|nr:AAA family ATPase [Bifidobacteriaceae bacterium]
FKSFASPQTLHFAEGVSCIVGPNGSGKSNILDAIEWCLGEQGTKNLRAEAMDDIIFFGSSARDKLSRADVICVFDNSDHKIPVDFSEVQIRRVLFRQGVSQYYLNGEQVRLNYIQKLLSNAGLGRQMHVIVGQGKLDSVLSASPQKRRAFIEEAAGILDYRYRKEKAARQLDNILGDMTRLNDIIEELKKQVAPLKRQAKMASQSDELHSKSHNIKSIILLDDYYLAKKELDTINKEFYNKEAVSKNILEEITQKRQAVLQLEEKATGKSSASGQINLVWGQLVGLAEKYRSFVVLLYERIKLNSNRPYNPSSLEDKKVFQSIEIKEKALKDLLQKHHANETAMASLKAKIDTLLIALDNDGGDILKAGNIFPKKFLQKWFDEKPNKALSELGLADIDFEFKELFSQILEKFYIFANLETAKKHLEKYPTHFAILTNGDMIVTSSVFTDLDKDGFLVMKNALGEAKKEIAKTKMSQANLDLKIGLINKELADLNNKKAKVLQKYETDILAIDQKLKTALEKAEKNLVIIDKRILDLEIFQKEISKELIFRDSNINQLRKTIDKLSDDLNSHRDSSHEIDLKRQQVEIKINQFRQAAVENLHQNIEQLEKALITPEIENSSIKTPVQSNDKSLSFPLSEVSKQQYSYDLDKLAGKLARLGKVNPLALEEYESINKRLEFLVSQYDDLEKTRINLKKIVRDLSHKINASFELAFQDTAKEFDIIFKELFPGGQGKLVLTDEEGGAGIDVKASPVGKKMISLSLMSGGERSLIALAMLVAIFKARPSPFYILDEVEAALDDVNLQRVLKLFNSLKSSSQLMVITHQKSTMEVADTLYGVTMRGDGITHILSHRLAN